MCTANTLSVIKQNSKDKSGKLNNGFALRPSLDLYDFSFPEQWYVSNEVK